MKLLVLVLLTVLIVECAKEKKEKEKAKETKLKKEDNAKKDAKTTAESKKQKKKKTGKDFEFEGKDQWTKEHLGLCFKETPLPEDYFCYVYYRHYEPVYVDPVSPNPLIIVYRKFIPQTFVDDFLYDVGRKQARSAKKANENGFMDDYVKNFKRRRANETIVTHNTMSGVARVFRRAQALIPMLNFSISGPWQVLSYKRGGHHAPHYDFITYSSPDQFSKTTRKLGNRFVTFSLTLETAEVGGDVDGPVWRAACTDLFDADRAALNTYDVSNSTVLVRRATTFIFLNQTVRTSPGDVLLFTNLNKDNTPSNAAAHGECPVEEGEKVTATLWLRPKGQELFNSHAQEGTFAFDAEKLVNPNMEFYGKTPFYDLYFYREQMMAQMAAQFASQEESKKK